MRSERDRLMDILDSIAIIEKYTAGMDSAAFVSAFDRDRPRFLKRTLSGIHLIRHDQRGVTIQFYALMITALLELHLKQLVLDQHESQEPQDGFKPSPQRAPTTPRKTPPRGRLKGVELVTWLNQGIHLSRGALHADHREVSPGSTGILPAIDWCRCPQAGKDTSAPRVGLSRFKMIARLLWGALPGLHTCYRISGTLNILARRNPPLKL